MRSSLLRAAAGVCSLAGTLFSAGPNGSASPYPQILCVVPMVGAGTVSDPRRPLFAPVAGQEAAESQKPSKGFVDRAAITSYRSIATDDGLFAIVVFEAHDRAAFRPILSDRRLLKSFDLGNTRLETLLPALRAAPSAASSRAAYRYHASTPLSSYNNDAPN